MPSKESHDRTELPTSHRRRFLQGVGATGIAGVLAGCLGGDGEENGDENGEENGTENGNETENGDDNGTENGDEPEPASFAVSGLDPEEATVTRGESVEVSATVENTGDEEGTQNVALSVDGEEIDSTELTLGGGDSGDVSFDLDATDLDVGDYDYVVSTDDEEATGSLTVEPVIGDEPDPLLSFEEDPAILTTGSSTLSGTLENPYHVAVEDGEVALSVPDGWEVAGEEGTSFDVDAEGSQDVTWELEIPEDADGEYELTADVSYSALSENAEASVTQAAVVVTPLAAPFGIDAGGELLDDPVVIDDLEFYPTADQRADIDMADGEIPEEARWWGDAIRFDPIPSAALNEEGTDIEGTDHDTLYWAEYWAEDELSIDLTFENGLYEVTLHWAEVVFDDPEDQERVFSAWVNDNPIVEELNLTVDVGYATAHTASTVVEVTDNQLTIDLESSVENPKISGIEIRESDADPDLVGHYDASALDLEDGAAVTSWTDANGLGPNLTQDDEDAQPTFQADVANGNSTVRFEGDSDFISAGDVLTDDTAGVTMAAAFSTHDPSVARQAILYNGSDDAGNGYGVFVNTEADTEGLMRGLYGMVTWWYADEVAVEAEQFYVVTFTIPEDDPGQPILRLNGVELELGVQVEAAPPEMPTNQFGIGQDESNQDAPPHFDGDIGEVQVYDRELSADERESLEAELAEKWGADSDIGGDDDDGDDGVDDEANLLENAWFEGGSDDGWGTEEFPGTEDVAFDLDDSEASRGEYSLRIDSEDGADAGWYQDAIAVEPDTDYTYSAMVKTDAIEPVEGTGAADGAPFGALINPHGYDPAVVVGESNSIEGTNDWTRLEVTFNTGDADEIRVNGGIGGWGNATGTVWFDDLSLVPADDD